MSHLGAIVSEYIKQPDNKRIRKGITYNTQDIKRLIIDSDKLDVDDLEMVVPKIKADTDTDFCRALYAIVKNNIRYVEDADGSQIVKAPSELWATKFGDCKSFAKFIAAGLRLRGIPYAYRFSSGSTAKEVHHVYIVCVPRDTGNLLVMDATINGFNTEAPYAYKNDYWMLQPKAAREVAIGYAPYNPQNAPAIPAGCPINPAAVTYEVAEAGYMNLIKRGYQREAIQWWNRYVMANPATYRARIGAIGSFASAIFNIAPRQREKLLAALNKDFANAAPLFQYLFYPLSPQGMAGRPYPNAAYKKFFEALRVWMDIKEGMGRISKDNPSDVVVDAFLKKPELPAQAIFMPIYRQWFINEYTRTEKLFSGKSMLQYTAALIKDKLGKTPEALINEYFTKGDAAAQERQLAKPYKITGAIVVPYQNNNYTGFIVDAPTDAMSIAKMAGIFSGGKTVYVKFGADTAPALLNARQAKILRYGIPGQNNAQVIVTDIIFSAQGFALPAKGYASLSNAVWNINVSTGQFTDARAEFKATGTVPPNSLPVYDARQAIKGARIGDFGASAIIATVLTSVATVMGIIGTIVSMLRSKNSTPLQAMPNGPADFSYCEQNTEGGYNCPQPDGSTVITDAAGNVLGTVPPGGDVPNTTKMAGMGWLITLGLVGAGGMLLLNNSKTKKA